MSSLTVRQVRNIINRLNRVDLERIEYSFIQKKINELFEGMKVNIVPSNFNDDFRFHRVVKHLNRPDNIRMLGYPPKEIVKSYQRCNSPESPMFYCSSYPIVSWDEVGVKAGDLVYISSWKIVNHKDFEVVNVVPELDENISFSAQFHIINTFIETRFLTRIHDEFSSQYKITSAMTEDVLQRVEKASGVRYPSVSHPTRIECFAVRPSSVDAYLELDYIEEIRVVSEVKKNVHIVESVNCAIDFDEDGKIKWANDLINWNNTGLTYYQNFFKEATSISN